ncbi:aminoacyl-tRNA hydrolase [Aminithiophilus ramosus]|uniref:Peptidyl-tRNA hydrolase n=2 Tax=Synergistales TaxID=649776 RepID=A0A9Q7AJU4_9BACT|nr:aminoacyl-tRNA hydrolase [Aminithiophilus ramosus]QTX31282.1 aminoacyl-tRNA hydrolase [Aminithiophilus ramosus]QVL35082.1 aminoacyl-tRNA hydrolase [Synergistota bacterium]
MRLVVGLGNPGPRYAFSRHNVGWLVVDGILAPLEGTKARTRYHGLFWGPFSARGGEFSLLKPTTYMNLSGRSVGAACREIPLDPSRLLVVCDDIHLPLGKIRFRRRGSAGGHNGLISVIGAVGTDEVPRLRIGVGEPRGGDLADWVTAEFSRSEEPLLDRVLEVAVQAVEDWLGGEDMEKLAGRYNGLCLS